MSGDKTMSFAAAREQVLKASAARDRIAKLFDPDTFVEVGVYAGAQCDGTGVVTGYGLVEGSPVYAFSQDNTQKDGAVGTAQGTKLKKLYDLALKTGAPVVGIYDSNGADLADGLGALNAYGEMLLWTNNLSGVVPQISLVLGVCAGPAAMIAAAADFVIMSEKGQFFMAPPAVCAGEGAGTAENAAVSGAAHVIEKDDDSAIASARKLIAMLPANNLSAPPMFDFSETAGAAQALSAAAADISSASLDDIISNIADECSALELHADFAKDCASTVLATVAGSTVGFVAASKDGELCASGCSKIARFVSVCDSFQIPVVTLVDCKGFAGAAEAQRKGGVREAAKLAHVYAEATTPKISVIVGKAYGSAFISFAGRAANSDYTVAWPNAVISPLDPKTAVAFMYGDKITKEKSREQVQADYATQEASALAAASKGHIDDVIDPAATRGVIISALDMLSGKRVTTLPKKHANIPM